MHAFTVTNTHTHKTLALATATSLLLLGCGQTGNGNTNAMQDAWQPYRQGIFTPDNPFYSQFGAVPYEIATTFDTINRNGTSPTIKPGDKIRYRIMDPRGKQIVMTAYMEKLRPNEAGNTGDWSFRATDINDRAIDTGDSCVNCHRQKIDNNYLFSLPTRP
jgi:hypothetical protein